MKKLESEIYFNRALLWLIFAQANLNNGAGKPLLVLNAALVILNLIHSYMIEKKSDDS